MAVTPSDGAGLVDLWAMAAELERQFAGYKRRFPERTSCSYMDDDDNTDIVEAVATRGGDSHHESNGVSNGRINADEGEEEDEEEAGDPGGGVRGRMYEAYTRRRDERLRTVWRARMERKEAEVMELWARVRGGGPAAAEDDDDAGEEAQEDGERRRSSDVAAPGRVSGKKHPRTRRSFSSANLTKSSRPDVGLRRALSQEPLPPEPPTGGSRTHGHHRVRAVNGTAPKGKRLAKENGLVRQAGPKPPRGGLPRGCSSGGMAAAVPPNASVAASASQTRLTEQAVASDRDDEAPKASTLRPVVGSGYGNGAGTARAASPESECGSEVVNSAAEAAEGGEAEGKNAVPDVERREGEEIAVQSPGAEAKLGNGEITSDSETEPSYVFIKKKDEKPMRLSDVLAGSDAEAEPHVAVKNGTGNADVEATRAADADTAAETASMDNAENSNEMSSFSGTGRSGRGSAPSSPPSCSSRAQSIERLLVEDTALLRKKREDRGAAGGRSVQAVSTPGIAGRRSSGTARPTSPRGTGIGFKKRFLSFGKKTRGRDGATFTECTSLASVPSPVARRLRSDTAKDAMVGSSSDAAASDDTGEACSLQSLVAASPAKSELSEMVPHQEKSSKPHRSFFSLRSFNCGRS